MAPFPDNLPPQGLDPVIKLLIYFGILFVIATAVTTWLITRRRSFPKPEVVQAPPSEYRETVVQTSASITETMSFSDTKDKLSSLKIEIQGAEASLSKLQEIKADLSQGAYQSLSEEYQSRVSKLSEQINGMIQSDIETSTGGIDAGASDDEMDAIEADLEKQLMDLDNDDFLTNRPKKNMDEIFEGSTPSESPAASTPAATPSPPPATSSGASSPAPPPQSGEQKRVPMPPPPKKSAAAPPPPAGSSGATPPKATPPAAKQPSSNQPLSAAQPMKVQSEEDDSMFAKSTSIAALRMDMLRELARLKKLIPEDEDKNQ